MDTATVNKYPTTIEERKEQYPELQADIEKLARGFYFRYGGDLDDWIGEANFYFTRACHSYNPSIRGYKRKRATFKSWVKGDVFRSLQCYVRVVIRNQRVKFGLEDDVPVNDNSFSLKQFIAELSDDAKAVVVAALNAPDEIMNSRRKFKAIIQFFQDMGWCGERIVETIGEIREALQ